VLSVDGFKIAKYIRQSFIDKAAGRIMNLVHITVVCIPVLLCFSERTLFAGRQSPIKMKQAFYGLFIYEERKTKQYVVTHNMNSFHVSAFFREFLQFCTIVDLIFYKLIHF